MAVDPSSQLGPTAAPSALGEPWSEEDLIALAQLRSVGIPIDHVAAYLRRTVAECEEEAGLRPPPKEPSPQLAIISSAVLSTRKPVGGLAAAEEARRRSP
jgi:hypothetical protein